MDTKIKVGVRVRPLNTKEIESSSVSVIDCERDKFVLTKPPAKKSCFEYDWTFDSASTSRSVYESSCRPLIENIFEGFNATFFAYGQTSSGKTHTLGGSDMNEGVIPFALEDIFERSRELHANGTKVEIELSYIEIYREECFDLLSAEDRKVRLDLKETNTGKTVLDGISVHPVQDITAVMQHLRNGAKIRSTGQTAMNAHSSRSHSICTLNLRIVRATTGAVTSQLHLVDLAGSERAKKTQATGEAFQEGISINRGLLALGNVVSALATRSMRNTAAAGSSEANSHIHVPYRESKLTRLLKDSLGGNGMTVMLACVSPADCNVEETLNTLRFASRASAIVNSARVNHSVGDSTDTVALLREVVELREKLSLLQSSQYGNRVKMEGADQQALIVRTAQTAAAQDRASYAFMVTAALRVTLSLKSVLLTCLQEGSYVVDADLLHIQRELQGIRKGLSLPEKKPKSTGSSGATATHLLGSDSAADSGGGELADLDFEAMLQLPPIMTAIEEVRLLEKDLRALERTIGGSATGSADWANDSLMSGSSLDISTGSADYFDPDSSSAPASRSSGAADLSFEASFDAEGSEITQDGDNICGHENSFDEGFSFTELDAQCMGDVLAQYIATQEQTASSSTTAAGSKPRPSSSSVDDALARQASQGLAAKEAEVTRVAALTNKYQSSIKTLRAEIQALESDQAKLQVRQQQQKRKPLVPTSTSTGSTRPASSAASSAEDLRIKQQLKEKTRLLEEKVKLLRTKESEFGKVSSQKTRLLGEVETMKKVVDDNKRKRAELQRRMREEATVHRNEKVQIKHSEIQARRGELQAQQSVVRLEGQLQSKEKVWKAQLESKEREAKALKELMAKKAAVRTMNAAVGKGGAAGGAVSAMGGVGQFFPQQGSSGLSTQDALNLKLWVDDEMDAHCRRAQAQEALTKEMFLRTKAAQQLQAVRRGSGSAAAAGVDTSFSGADAKTLENELRARSATIAGLNAVLGDLGSAATADKKRFTRFIDVKETRQVGEVLFDVACKAQKREQTATRRLRAMQEQLQRCKQQLQEAQSSAEYYRQQAQEQKERIYFTDEESERAEMDETFYPSDAESACASENSDSSSDSSARGTKGRSKKASGKRKVDSPEDQLELPAGRVKKVRIQVQSKKRKSEDSRTSVSYAEDSDNAHSDADESDRDHGNDSSSEDSDNEDRDRRKTAKGGAKKARTGTAGAGGVKKAKRSAPCVDPDFDDSEITLPLSKHTISELKRFLAAKGLPVSGVKAELIKRLQTVLPAEVTPSNDENAAPAAAHAGVEDSNSSSKAPLQQLLQEVVDTAQAQGW